MKRTMKINTKIMALITASLVLTAGVVGGIAVWQTRQVGEEAVDRIQHLGQQNIQRIQKEGAGRIEAFRADVIARKKEYLRSQVQTVFSAVQKTRNQTQAMNDTSVLDDQVKKAIVEEHKAGIADLVGALRYGPQGKDYFWINDMEPRMVMHPYKPQLNGKDLSGNQDPNGKRLFVEMVRVCKEKGEGFVDYMWPKPGMDEPQPKLSYVKLLPEWGWIVGTGIYIDDVDALVQAEKAALEKEAAQAEAESRELIESTTRETEQSVRDVLLLVTASTLAVIVLVLIGAFVFTRRSITRPVNRMIEGLTDSADQVASASGQISTASQSLAEGASEQAASIEETSSSLEEMASMTRQNADHSTQADQIMRETRETVETANRSMSELIASMEAITQSSDETAKIVKTIDEIAFQTNLLALNAAVEAARAGEAGAGFAVVADEVRNLAMRAAEAARNTANLIDDTTVKVQEGSGLVSRTNEAFEQVSTGSDKVANLVSEISAASGEQAEGIEQVNKAVSEMDKVVQENASRAEESAAAAEEMNAQSEQLKDIIRELEALVKGSSGNGSAEGRTRVEAKGEPAGRPKMASHRLEGGPRRQSDPTQPRHAGASSHDVTTPRRQEVNPEEAIPFDNASAFEDF